MIQMSENSFILSNRATLPDHFLSLKKKSADSGNNKYSIHQILEMVRL